MEKRDPLQLVLQRMRARNNSEQTMDRFRLYIEKFLRWLGAKKIPWEKANCDDFMNFLSEIKACGNTKATMFYAMRTIFQIWGKKWTLDKAEAPKKSAPNRPFYTLEEINKIVKTADKIDYRSAVLVRVARDCGCRRAAMREILKNDFIDGEKPLLKIPAVKKGNPITMPIREDTAEAIRKLLIKRKDKNPYLFVENDHQCGLVQMSNIFTKVAKLAGVYKDGAGIHAARRGKVTRLVNAGMHEVKITSALGWQEGSKMVHVYAQLDQSEIQNEAASLDPVFNEKKKEES